MGQKHQAEEGKPKFRCINSKKCNSTKKCNFISARKRHSRKTRKCDSINNAKPWDSINTAPSKASPEQSRAQAGPPLLPEG